MNKKGFTLVELLAVIVILAVVMLIGGTTVLPMMQKAQKSALGEEGLTAMKKAEELMASDAVLGNAEYNTTSNVCYSLKYLCEKGVFDKGCDDNYTGSVLSKYTTDGKRDFKFWISNGTYSFNGADKETYANIENSSILLEKETASNNCGKDYIDDASIDASIKSQAQGGYDGVSSSAQMTYCNDTNCSSTISIGDIKQFPAGYQELSYIQSTGTQYINTGVSNWNNTIEYQAKVAVDHQDSGSHTFFGAWDVWNTSGTVLPTISTYSSYNLRSDFKSGSAGTIDIGVKEGQIGTISLIGNTISWSEGSSIAFNRESSFTNSKSIVIFAVAKSTGVGEYSKYRLYSFKLWQDGSLIRNFIPCKETSTGKIGLYDLVGKRFYASSGSGSLIAGEAI